MNTRIAVGTIIGLTMLCLGAALAQTSQGYKPVAGPHTLNPGDWPAHYPFADETEAAIAASEVHHVRYIDSHVRLVEVAYFPGVQGNVHGHPYPSVFAVDAPVPKATNTPMNPAANMVARVSPPPDGAAFPFCRAASPQGLHHETNQDSYPHHFYRLEFLRLDGTGLKDHWREWYPRAAGATDGASRLLYEDNHVRLVEVLVEPGAMQPLPDPYPAVLAFDTVEAAAGTEAAPGAHDSPPVPGFDTLKCRSTGSAAAGPATRNAGSTPIHYYRIEFKRIDGDGIKDHWREWYPWMAAIKDSYDRTPYVPNF